MALFSKPEVIILKESSDSKTYLSQLEELQKEVKSGSDLCKRLEKEIAITKAGIAGEDAIMFELKNSGMDLVVLHDIYLETEDGRGAQIDYIVVTPYVNVLIECKNLFGDIEINNRGDFIRTFSYGGRKVKEGIYSPVTQNERHLSILKECRLQDKNAILRFGIQKWFEEFNKSLVVLSNPKTVLNDRYAPKEIKEKVIRCDQLVAKLKEMRSSEKDNLKEMMKTAERLLAKNVEGRKEYIGKFRELKEEADRKGGEDPDGTMELSTGESSLTCPWCGKELVLRTAKKGTSAGKQFYGCSGFPKCRYVKNLKAEN